MTMLDTQLLRPLEVAEILAIGRSRAYEMIRSGELPVVRIGRSLRVPAHALQEWISNRTVEAGADNLQ